MSPLRLTSLDDGGLFGVCAYYPYYAAWPSREPADIDIAPLLAGVVGDTATLGNELYVIPGPDYPDAFLMRHNGGELGADEAWDDVALPSGAGGRDLIDIFSPGPDRMVVVGTAGHRRARAPGRARGHRRRRGLGSRGRAIVTSRVTL